MKIEISERVETHETAYRGMLSGAQVLEIVKHAVREAAGASRHGLRLELRPTDVASPDNPFPDVAFTLIHDHDWVLKDDCP